MEERSGRQLSERIDRDVFDATQFVSFKVPVSHLAYYNPSSVFERVNGHIEIGGVPYQYVQRRIFNDSLELLCIPNMRVLALRQDVAKRAAHQEEPGMRKMFFSDPFTVTAGLVVRHPAVGFFVSGCRAVASLLSSFAIVDGRPPDAVV